MGNYQKQQSFQQNITYNLAGYREFWQMPASIIYVHSDRGNPAGVGGNSACQTNFFVHYSLQLNLKQTWAKICNVNDDKWA